MFCLSAGVVMGDIMLFLALFSDFWWWVVDFLVLG